MKNTLISLLIYLSLCAILNAQYSGIYKGDYFEDTPTNGPDEGIFIALVDANNNVTSWIGNEYWADKYRFKISDQGVGSLKSSGGYNVTAQFNSDGGISLTLDKGATASVTNITKVSYPYTPGAASLQEDLIANPTFYSNNPLELNLNGFEQGQISSNLEDQLSLLSGEWSAKFKVSVFDVSGSSLKVTVTGDLIIIPDSIYFYAKALGESALIRQDANTNSNADIYLTGAAYDFDNRTLSASANVALSGYNGTVSYTIDQVVSYFDTDKDGLSDYEEINTYSTNPLQADSDSDGMSDYAEIEAASNPNNQSEYPTYMKVKVSLAKGISGDGDASVLIDGVSYPLTLVRGKGTLEVALPTGSTYSVSASLGALTSGTAKPVLMNKATSLSLILDGDSDEDGLSDSQEARYKGDPNNADTDGDGISDGDEVYTYRTSVNVADSDKDGFTDKQEVDLNTNPLSSKDKPEAYIERPVFVNWILTYEVMGDSISEDWDTAEVAYFLSLAAGDPQRNATIHLKYSLDGSSLQWLIRNNSRDIDVTSLMRPITVSKPAQLEGEVSSSVTDDGSYYAAEMFSLAISAGKTKSLSLVVSGESSFLQVGPNTSGLDIDLAISSDYKVLGLLKDLSMSDGPILIDGTLTMGNEVANVLGQTIGPVN